MLYPWYKIVNDEGLQQGDIFRNYPVFSPEVDPSHIEAAKAGEKPTVSVKIEMLDVIVMSQSCDLAHQKITSVILCPLWKINEIEKNLGDSPAEIRKSKEEIRKGIRPSLHMIGEDEKSDMEISVVEFTRIFTTPKAVLTSFAKACGSRVRLLPPYREHLSQSFARYFMRVGLPVDIPGFK